MKKVIAVSAGHDTIKKGSNPIRDRIRYLNYGLLGLATILKHQGDIDITVFQADYYTAEDIFRVIEQSGIDIRNECECFLLSIPSYYSMSWCVQFCKIAKLEFGKKIIVGGRWVVDHHTEWVREKLKYADTIMEGFGERKLAEYFAFPGWESIADGSRKCFEWLDYELLYDYRKYQPSIEVSRGCGAGCQFCADKNNQRLRNKSVDTIMRELNHLDRIFGEYSVYFEAPHFIFEQPWITQLCDRIQSRGHPFLWRCTSRVETVPLNLLPHMREAGLKVLDIGLESASKQQLLNMHKTRNPERYLEQAEKLLIACRENDIWVKFNLLLYAGETHATVDETTLWLITHREFIKDISVSSLVYYYNMDSLSDLTELGATIPTGERIDDMGYIDLDLSPEIDHQEAKRISAHIPKYIANQKDFYEIKAISYFEKDYTYSAFLKDLEKCDPLELPFMIDNRCIAKGQTRDSSQSLSGRL